MHKLDLKLKELKTLVLMLSCALESIWIKDKKASPTHFCKPSSWPSRIKCQTGARLPSHTSQFGQLELESRPLQSKLKTHICSSDNGLLKTSQQKFLQQLESNMEDP